MAQLPQLYVILDIESARGAGHAVVDIARAASKAGARLFQCRFKDLSDTENEAFCREVIESVGDDATVLVNGDIEVAQRVGADGVHLTSTAGTVAEARRAELAVVGRSCHSLLEARRAAHEGVDFVTMSPIFRSQSKPDYGPVLGIDQLESVCDELETPVYALAGITSDRVGRCLDAGAYGVAVMSGICGAEDVRRAVAAYLQASP